MKKIILIIFISLMFSNIGFAEMKVIESDNIHDDNDFHYFVATTFKLIGNP